MSNRVLIVDPNASNRISLRAMLNAEFFETLGIDECKDFARAILNFKPDLILLSTRIGRESGYAFCQKIKTQNAHRFLPVILTTHNPSDRQWGRALTSLADDIRVLPDENAELLTSLRKLQREKSEIDALINHVYAGQNQGLQEPITPFKSKMMKPINLVSIGDDGMPPFAGFQPKGVDLTSYNAGSLPDKIPPGTDIIALNPCENNLRVLSKLHQQVSNKDIPILCLCDETKNIEPRRLLEIGATDIVAQNSKPEEFLVRIQSLTLAYQRKKQLRNSLKKRVKESIIDPLTGLFNRRHALQFIKTTFQTARKSGKPFCVMMLDVDKFKSVNDQFGHVTGDTVLKDIAKRLRKNLRTMDMIGRYGGDEFIILLPDTTRTQASEIAHRLRQEINETDFQIGTGLKSHKVTLSIGVASKTNRHKTESDLIKCADAALYSAKEKGRNRVTIHVA